jgi:hypothetical protein
MSAALPAVAPRKANADQYPTVAERTANAEVASGPPTFPSVCDIP